MSDIPRFSPNEEAEMQLQWNIENGSDVWASLVRDAEKIRIVSRATM